MRVSHFFSFSSLRWWGSPQTSTWRRLSELTFLELDARGQFVPRRIEPLGNDRDTRQPAGEQPALLGERTERCD
jgi:hypothetical protein